MNEYNQNYFDDFYENSYLSAIEILKPLFNIKSFNKIIDVGCGSGAWLQACYDLSDNQKIKLIGVDGDYMQKQKKFNKAKYLYKNLENEIISGSYEFLISVEVAEHLSKNKATFFIENLCNLSDIILFSAAQVGQGGKNHLNERPLNYWKKIFAQKGYRPYTFFKNYIWQKNVFKKFPYYIANTVLYVKNNRELFQEYDENHFLNITHPNFLQLRSRENISFKEHLSSLLPSLFKGLKKKLNNK